jgi:hypothetical protein
LASNALTGTELPKVPIALELGIYSKYPKGYVPEGVSSSAEVEKIQKDMEVCFKELNMRKT